MKSESAAAPVAKARTVVAISCALNSPIRHRTLAATETRAFGPAGRRRKRRRRRWPRVDGRVHPQAASVARGLPAPLTGQSTATTFFPIATVTSARDRTPRITQCVSTMATEWEAPEGMPILSSRSFCCRCGEAVAEASYVSDRGRRRWMRRLDGARDSGLSSSEYATTRRMTDQHLAARDFKVPNPGRPGA